MIMHLTKLFVAFFAIHSIKEKYAVNFFETYSTRVIIESCVACGLFRLKTDINLTARHHHAMN